LTTATLHNGVVKLFVRLISAVALGIGTIFGHKANQESHWSDPPNWIADDETDDATGLV